VPDIRLYDTIYQERYSGLPQDHPDEYKQSSPITFAGQLKGELLVVHGTGDDNVHYQGTEALVNALVAANKQFTIMPYPNRTHGIFEGPGTTRHLYGLLTRFLEEKLPPGPLGSDTR
jgi:dipeptidyl-peptidase-4